jgi:hypothetical protein
VLDEERDMLDEGRTRSTRNACARRGTHALEDRAMTCSLNATGASIAAREASMRIRCPTCDGRAATRSTSNSVLVATSGRNAPGLLVESAEHTPPSCQSGIARGDSPWPPLSNAGCDVP